MDILFFYSTSSPASMQLLQDIPQLIEKGISVDSEAVRQHMNRLKIYDVPTLLVITNQRVLHRVIGYMEIKYWVASTGLLVDQIATGPKQPSPQPPPRQPSQRQATSIDDLLPPEEFENIPVETTPPPQQGPPASIRNIAEQMQRERDLLVSPSKK
jgi:hypothetical protein